MIAPGFQMLAGSIVPSHAYVHVVDYGIDVNVAGMAVKSGDLIHADRHGAVVVPTDKIDAMKTALDGLAGARGEDHRGRQGRRRRRGHQGGDERLDWTMTSRRRDRRETNPALSTRRLKLGTFQTNLDSGCVMSDLDGRLDITWPNTVALARLAEEMEFEALVPVARWQGFGGATNPQGPGFEAYTWAAGIAAVDHQARRVRRPRTSRSIIRSSPPSSRR